MRKFLLLFLPIFLALAAFARAEQDSVLNLPVGNLEVLALLDGEGSMEAKLLPDLANDPVMQSYFNAGPLPSAFRCYYFQDGDRKVLIDTGWGTEQAKKGKLLELLEANGIAPDSITDILMTHLDVDHVGGLVKGDKAVFPNATLRLSKPEYDAWSQGKVPGRNEDSIKLSQKALEVYKDRTQPFEFGAEILPGVTTVDARGHTPGHTAYDIVSNGEKLSVVGDLLHVAPVQLIKPAMSTIYDGDPKLAAETRERLLKKAVEEKSIFATMHLPGVSPVRERSDGGYAMREPR